MTLLSSAFNNKVCTVRRYGAGTPGADGHWGPPTVVSTFTIAASVQPLTETDAKDLPEGMRVDDVRWVYTDSEIRTVQTQNGQDLPDELEFDGSKWRVYRVAQYTVLSGHYRAQVTRITTP